MFAHSQCLYSKWVSPKALRKFSEGVRLNVLHIPKEYLDFFSREKGRIFSVFGILCLFSSAAVCRNTLIISEQNFNYANSQNQVNGISLDLVGSSRSLEKIQLMPSYCPFSFHVRVDFPLSLENSMQKCSPQ